jgi:hypothetical protein
MSDDRFAEFDLLRRLRAAPELLDQVRTSSGSELHVQTQLRRQFPEDLVRAALELNDLRQRGAKKFTRSGEMWFNRKGLQQATSEAVARHKAQRFSGRGRGQGRVWDYCSGAGGDTLALANRCDVVAVDLDPAACLCTLWNAQVYEVASRVQPVCADVTTLSDRSGWVHLDPDRRADGQNRRVRIEDSVPGVEFIEAVMREFAGGSIKLSPAANFVGRFPDAEIELISLDGECKEAAVWFGELAQPGLWRATVLPAGVSIGGDPLETQAPVSRLGEYFYDPNPAVVRAGLVDLAAEQLGLRRLDAEEEYLTSDRRVHSPLVQSFEVLAELPNNDREIRGYFRASEFGSVEIKCRRAAIDPERVRRKLPLPGNEAGALIYARAAGKTRAVVCRRLKADSAAPDRAAR